MKKIILAILLLQLPFLNFNAAAYDNLEFKGQIKNSAIINPIDISVCQTNISIIDSKSKSLLIFDGEGKLLKKQIQILNLPRLLHVPRLKFMLPILKTHQLMSLILKESFFGLLPAKVLCRANLAVL